MPSRLSSCGTYLPQYIGWEPLRALRELVFEIVGVRVLFAAIHLDDWRDERDDIAAERLDERCLLDRKAVRQLHELSQVRRLRPSA